MKHYFILLAILNLLAGLIDHTTIVAANERKKTSTEIDKLGQQKLRQIEQLESAGYGNLIEFNVADYKRLVLKNPRPYDIVMLFNVR